MVPLPAEAQTPGVVEMAPEKDRPLGPDRSSRGHRSSHDETAGVAYAGWLRGRPGRFRELLPECHPHVSWLRPSVLWATRNDKVAAWLADPTNDERRRWVARQLERGAPPDLTLRDHEEGQRLGVLVLSDTGEGDASQMAVVPPLLAAGEGTRFALICSDVIYPSGDVNEYLGKFYFPYKDYPAPIYALPGNHDWYDDLTSFMLHFCGAEPLPPPRLLGGGTRQWLRRALWRRPRAVDPAVIAAWRALRPSREDRGRQPGPYFAIETGPVRLVGIDTGILGGIDAEQAAWLRRVSAGPKPKILLTGRPLYVNGHREPGPIEGEEGTVDDIVRDPAHHYVAAIGGDTHNYQRYPVRQPDGRTIQYLVAGGGGAFMHATHHIPKVALEGVTEEEFRCYPLRGDCLSMYASNFGRRRRLRFLRVHPDAAAAVLADRLGTTPVRQGAQAAQREGSVGWRARLLVWLLTTPPVPDKAFQRVCSEFLDWDEPPLFKSFLRIDADAERVRIRCFQATGWEHDEDDPPVEDEVVIALGDAMADGGAEKAVAVEHSG